MHVVGGHEDDAALGRRHAVDRVQQAAQRQAVQALLVEVISVL